MKSKTNKIILIAFASIAVIIFGGALLVSAVMGNHPHQKKWDEFSNNLEKDYEILIENKDSASVSQSLNRMEKFMVNNDTTGLLSHQKELYMQLDSILTNRKTIENKLKVERRLNNAFYLDGSSLHVVEAVKHQLNDPDSFEHVQTSHYTNPDMDYIAIDMTFRAKNGFGATVTRLATCQLYDDNTIKNLKIEQ